MAVNLDSFTGWLGGLFGDEERLEEFNNDAEGVLNQAGFGNATAVDVNQAMTRLAENNQGNQSFTSQGGAANFAGSGVVNLPPPPPAYEAYEASGDGGGLAGAIESINHYTSVTNVTEQSFEDNDTTVINDQDTNIDNSVNQDITAFGDVNQDFDNDVVTGDENALGGDGSQVNSGDGAVQAGGSIVDSTIATGDVGGSVTGDVSDSVVGDNNNVIDDSSVGAASFGDGDAINAENVLQGDGTLVDDISGDANINTGSGDQTVVDDSIVSESAVGSGSVESNDIDIDASEGSAVAFGEGSSAEGTDTDITNDSGTVQVAGDDSVQIAETDNSVDASINDSFNTDASVDASINDSFNTEVDASINDSFDTDVEDNDTTTVVEDNDTTVEDNDFIDFDA
jgi:hypothetical protein